MRGIGYRGSRSQWAVYLEGNKMNSVLRVWMTSCLLAAVLIGCATPQGDRRATSVVDFLYPNEKEPVAEQGIPVLKLPMRVGIAFVPETDRYRPERITEARKGQLLEEVSEHFRSRDFIRGIEIIPSAYLRSKGGFENLDQIRAMFGVDVIALVSYHQTRACSRSPTGRSSVRMSCAARRTPRIRW
jgi:rhombotail lipoprotein